MFKKFVLVLALLLASGVLWILRPRVVTSLRKAGTQPNTAAHEPAFAVQPPTATEVFALRSKCGELGDKIRDGNVITPNLTQSVVSHYDPRTNRCYVALTVQTVDQMARLAYVNRTLYDGQTGQSLAETHVEKEGVKFGQVFIKTDISSDTAFDQANRFINKMMEDDRSR